MSRGEIKAILFDAYGTLCHMEVRRRPYRQLARQVLDPIGFTKAVMTQPLGLMDAAHRGGLSLTPEQLAPLAQDLADELAGVRLYAEVSAVLGQLRAQGYRLGVVANLAQPYAEPVRQLLHDQLDLWCWSFELGYPKPHPELYRRVCQQLDLPPAAVLMVGDTRVEDYTGAKACGLQARWLRRRGTPQAEEEVASLSALAEQLLP
ncbi:HAD family hydrolase [Pseudaeromonas paramecii]|uniref:HAD family hydrolase n=1 Tax=Pseudaeromonas paramecii TaxID=2138166 RepID=A0ABP8QAC9_9GAMM